MPSVGHVAVGLAGARLRRPPERVHPWLWVALLVGASCAPDIDILVFRFGVPYGAPFGHRGALHSLAVAGLCAVSLGGAAWLLKFPPLPVAAMTGLIMATHGILDAFTDGGMGIALLWPFSHERYFAPWRPIPVAPLGLRLLSAHGAVVMLRECLLFLPAFIVALWPRRTARDRAAVEE
jgi:inner membrane protein